MPLGIAEANREVKVVVELAEANREQAPKMTRAEWARFVDQTAGAWKGDLERPEQGEFETREQWPSPEFLRG